MVAFQVVRESDEPLTAASAVEPQGIDLIVEGVNLTARLPRSDVAPMLRDAAHELALLVTDRRRRATVRGACADEPWELGFERVGREIWVSLFGAGADVVVAFVERAFDGRALTLAVLDAIDEASQLMPRSSFMRELSVARTTLANAVWLDARHTPALAAVAVEPDASDALRISAELVLREAPDDADLEPRADRTDLLGLLGRGTVRIAVGGRTRVFPQAFVFLFAERLLGLAGDLLEAWEQGRSFYRRIDALGVLFGIRFARPGSEGGEPEEPGAVWLTIGERRGPGAAEPWTFRLPDATCVVESILAFGRALGRALIRHDPDQRKNLRLATFRQGLRDVADRLEETTQEGAKVNPAPERYRVYANPDASPAAEVMPPTRLGFGPGWTATVPGIDLRSTFLCGDHLVIGGARETAVVERHSGAFLWRKPTQPAVSVVTPLGLARIFAEGSIALHDFATGDVKLVMRVAPRVGGAVTGAVVNAPGLPKLLVVTEGDRYLSALDLRSGEIQWRHAARVGKSFRLRRAGKLLIVAAGDATLSALDVVTGEVVWRVCDRLRFALQIGLDRESAFAIAGEAEPKGRASARLYHLDPYAGAVHWTRELTATVGMPFGAPLVTGKNVVVLTRSRRGLGMMAFDRMSSEPTWSVEPGIAPTSSAWLVIDDRIVFNCETGAIFAVSADTGSTLWRHSLPRGMEGDQPRKLEPILRSGALFVPQQKVHVVRPRDGAIIGCVEADLIPDMLRVDERCDVYVAEDSGHVASFRAGPKLRLV
jgi:outer membrane protein assembly factor BamB